LSGTKKRPVVRAAALRGLYEVTGTPDLHVNFGKLMNADDPDKLKQMIPGKEFIRWSKVRMAGVNDCSPLRNAGWLKACCASRTS
jgi:hypothetical protein